MEEKTHCMALLPSEDANPRYEVLNPIIAVANESGYHRLSKIAFSRDLAQKFVDQYNRDVLKLTPAQAETIVSSSMFPGVKYPGSLPNFERRVTQWPSEIVK